MTAGEASPGEVSPVAPPSQAPRARAPWLERLLGSWKGVVILYLAFAGAYLGASGGRVRQHSPYNHFLYLADGWLHGRLSLQGPPPNDNDWSKVVVLVLRDGLTVMVSYGGRGGPNDRFYPLRGRPETIPAGEFRSRSAIRYVSFPPFPAVLMLPFVAVWHLAFNDVLFTALWAALNPVLLFLLLQHRVRRGLSRRSVTDNLWLTVMFGVGSVYYFCSVVGEVWYTAHVVLVTGAIGFVWASLDAARPWRAGLFVGLAGACRPSGLFMGVFFLLEALAVTGVWQTVDGKHRLRRDRAALRALAGKLARYAVPMLAIQAVLWLHIWVRFSA